MPTESKNETPEATATPETPPTRVDEDGTADQKTDGERGPETDPDLSDRSR